MKDPKQRILKIGDKVISDQSDCFIIAEIGQNHQGDIETCERIFYEAKHHGVDAVKLQKRNNRALYTKKFFDSPYNSENSFGPTYGIHRQALEFNKREYQHLKRYAEKLGLIFFATAWEFQSADLLNEIGMPLFKIASADIVNTPLLEYIAKFKKPMIISTGGASMEDIQRAYKAITKYHHQLAILHCTAAYPASVEFLNLRVIETLRAKFPDVVIGLSDHFNGIWEGPVAYTLGARIIEKHFTLSRAMKGSDHAFSLEYDGMRRFVRDLRRVKDALGDGVKKVYPEEKAPLYKMVKSIVAAKKLPVGHILTITDLTFKAPSDGLPPFQVEQFYGKKLKIGVKTDDVLTLEHI